MIKRTPIEDEEIKKDLDELHKATQNFSKTVREYNESRIAKNLKKIEKFHNFTATLAISSLILTLIGLILLSKVIMTIGIIGQFLSIVCLVIDINRMNKHISKL